MLKKLTLLAMSVGALLAFAAPVAQATTGPLITNGAKGTSTLITATSTNTITHTSAGTLECTTVDLTLHATENKNTTVHGHGTGTAEGTPTGVEPGKHKGHCNVSSGAIAEITHVNVSTIHLTKHGAEITGTAAFSFTYHLRSATGAGLIAECTFGGTVPVKHTGANNINVLGEITKTAGSAFCPAAGTITGDFALTDKETGLPVVFD
jgi:hypothetical protein